MNQQPAIVAPIKVRRYTCMDLGICQGHDTPCADCENGDFAQPETSNDMPASLWDRIWFYGVVGVATVCTVVVVCGTAGWYFGR
jgi:hypothetical protein